VGDSDADAREHVVGPLAEDFVELGERLVDVPECGEAAAEVGASLDEVRPESKGLATRGDRPAWSPLFASTVARL